MLQQIFDSVFGNFSKRKLKTYLPLLKKVNALEQKFQDYSQEQLQEAITQLQERAKNGASSEELLPETFAVVRKAGMETLQQRAFDVQILGAIALNDGQIAEMKTGEGKTLTSTFPLVLQSLYGKGVHLVTVNDYLAERDASWMGEIYNYLGLTVGVIKHDMEETARREAYNADITYGTNNEFGFDYLRDNMKFDLTEYVQRDHFYSIVDEVDSVLIDEARTPLIISGPSEDTTENYYKVNSFITGLTRGWTKGDNPNIEAVARALDSDSKAAKEFLQTKEDSELVVPGDFTLDEKAKNIQLTEQGVELMEKRLDSFLKTSNLFDFENIEILHHVNQALKAHYVFKRNTDYVVQNGQVVIVDEFTGRLMEGRRFSEGLHQALEAKENVKIEAENQTLASITFQNYFRKYTKLAGMTGTAETEAEEFSKIYGLGVVAIPTNKPIARKDHADIIYKTIDVKNKAICTKVAELHKKGQPVLVGTASIENSEYLSSQFKKHAIPHKILNAKFHKQEAEIIAQAGKKGAVTIATNMAGRGTDIKLSEEVLELGGLFILGTERHESRRIDNQLRGRAGRQGDMGESRFFLSLDDNLLRIFGGERIAKLMDRLHIKEDEPIEHMLISRAIASSQSKVEAHNFDIRKHLLEYDDVMNRQREIIYKQRQRILGEDSLGIFTEMCEKVGDYLLDTYCESKHIDQWDTAELAKEIKTIFDLSTSLDEELNSLSAETFDTWLHDQIKKKLTENLNQFEEEIQLLLLRRIQLEITDNFWKDHLLSMDHMKEGIGMQGYAQKDPLTEYKKEGFTLFQELMSRIELECVQTFFHVQLQEQETLLNHEFKTNQSIELQHQSVPNFEQEMQEETPVKKVSVRKRVLPSRNSPCWCGSGKKYKKCHWNADQEIQENETT